MRRIFRAGFIIAVVSGGIAANASAGSIVQIEQIGSDATIAVSQSGQDNQLSLTVGSALNLSPSDRVEISARQAGSQNTMSVDLGGGSHDSRLTLNQEGSFNSLGIQNLGASSTTIEANQAGDGKFLTISLTPDAVGAQVTVSQSGAGAHRGEISLLSARHQVSLSQSDGVSGPGGGHRATISLDGDARSVSVTQSGTTPREATVTTSGSCASPCAPILLNQN